MYTRNKCYQKFYWIILYYIVLIHFENINMCITNNTKLLYICYDYIEIHIYFSTHHKCITFANYIGLIDALDILYEFRSLIFIYYSGRHFIKCRARPPTVRLVYEIFISAVYLLQTNVTDLFFAGKIHTNRYERERFYSILYVRE